jgi:selenocysteine-specific elongation factor
VRTIGGGQILNPIPLKHRRFRKEVVVGLHEIVDKSPVDITTFHVDQSGFRGVSFSDLRLMTNLTEKQLENTLQELLSKKILIQVDKENRIYIHHKSFNQLKQQVTDDLTAYHTFNPLKAGMPKEELKSKFPPYLEAKLFNLVLNQLIKETEIVQTEETVRLTAHRVSLGGDQEGAKIKILETYKKSGLEPPFFRDIGKQLDMDPAQAKDVLTLLIDEGVIIKTKDDLYFHVDAVNALKERLINFLKANPEMTTPQFKEIAGVSRKYLIPLIEHFDSTNVTLRIGDIRKLRSG